MEALHGIEKAAPVIVGGGPRNQLDDALLLKQFSRFPSSLSDLRPPEAHVRIVTSIRSLPGCRQ